MLSREENDLLTQIERFFISYNEGEGRKFKPTGRADAKQAKKLLEAGWKRFEQVRKR